VARYTNSVGVAAVAVKVNTMTAVVMLQKKVGTRYVNVRAAYAATYRVYVYASGGRNASAVWLRYPVEKRRQHREDHGRNTGRCAGIDR
jgi:hypothetical protein